MPQACLVPAHQIRFLLYEKILPQASGLNLSSILDSFFVKNFGTFGKKILKNCSFFAGF